MKASLKHDVAGERGQGLTRLGGQKSAEISEKSARQTTRVGFVLWHEVSDKDVRRIRVRITELRQQKGMSGYIHGSYSGMGL